MKIKKIALACAAAGITLIGAGQAQAANWLMLQGTEPEGSVGRAKVWGFIQAQYQKDFSDGNAAPPKFVGPDLTSQSAFNVNRARIGVRGANFPLDGKTNYFLLVEFGNNALTNAKDSYAPRVSDAGVTLNHPRGCALSHGSIQVPWLGRRSAGHWRSGLHQLHRSYQPDDAGADPVRVQRGTLER